MGIIRPLLTTVVRLGFRTPAARHRSAPLVQRRGMNPFCPFEVLSETASFVLAEVLAVVGGFVVGGRATKANLSEALRAAKLVFLQA